MPSKKKQKSKSKNKVYLLLLLFVLLSLGVYLGYRYIQDRNEQLEIRREITDLSSKLNVLDETLTNSYGVVSFERNEYCYKPGRKFSTSGPIYCVQEIILEEEGLTDQVILDAYAVINKKLLENSQIKLTMVDDDITNRNRNQKTTYTRYKSPPGTGCSAELSYRLQNAYGEPLNSELEFKIYCLRGGFDEFIYPEL